MFYRNKSRRHGHETKCKSCYDTGRSGNWDRSVEGRQWRREYDKLKYARNRERYIEYSKRYAQANPDKRCLYAQNKKHRRRLLTDGGITSRELAAWRRTQPKVCYWCGARNLKRITIDHYIPLSRGGKHEVGNLVIACKSCNSSKHAKDPIQFAQERGRLF